MKASEIFASLSPATAEQVLAYLQETQKPTYRAAIQTLATQRRLRPVFIERKPRADRHAWLQHALGRPSGEQIAGNLLQMWLLGTQATMLCDFLDALGIAHDEHGGIDSLPACPPPEKLDAAIDALLAKYPAETVAIYLHCFLAMDIAGWPPLAEKLEKDDRLRLPATAAAAANATPAPATANG